MGCPKGQEPMRIKLHILNFIFIIYNTFYTFTRMLYAFPQPLYHGFEDVAKHI